MIIKNIIISFFILATTCSGYAQKLSMKIGTNPTLINSSAALEVESITKGLLLPRMASTQRINIGSPSAGLQVYDTNTNSVWYYNGTVWINSATVYIPITQYPTFDSTTYRLLNGALWVGFDATLGIWKYNKQASGRGLTDPGNPNTWTINNTTIGTFNGDFTKLPSGTHINFKYDPTTYAAKYNQDDIAVRLGSLWVDKYEARIIDVSVGIFKDNDDNTDANPAENDIRGNGQQIPETWMSFSQKDLGSTGMSWYVAQITLNNNGKRLLTNAEWILAAAGSSRTDATSMPFGGNTWGSPQDQDISKYAVVGCVGSLWEWIADMGQYGPAAGPSSQTTNIGGDAQYNINGYAITNNTSQLSAVHPSGSGYLLRSALVLGGAFDSGAAAGVFALNASLAPSFWFSSVGFRGVRF